MANKLTLTDVANLQQQQTVVNAINNNNTATIAAINNTLSRDGTLPNNMIANLDMNSYRVVNLPEPLGLTEPLRLQDANLLNGGGTITIDPDATFIPIGGFEGQVLSKKTDLDYDLEWTSESVIPAGGSTGQVLAKNSNTDFDLTWTSETEIPAAGSTGQALVKNSGVDFDMDWGTVHQLPSGGSTGQVLTKTTSSDYATSWVSQSNVTPFAYGREIITDDLHNLVRASGGLTLPTIASANTCDIGVVAGPVVLVTGTTPINSFGNTMIMGQGKTLYVASTGLVVNTSSTLKLNTNFGSSVVLPYVSTAGDILHVTCIGISSGNNVYAVQAFLMTGQSISEATPTGASRQASFYTSLSNPLGIEYFSNQVVVSDWSTGVQGGSASGLSGPGRAARLVNVGDNGFDTLTCNLGLSNQIGGTDGFTLDPTANSGIGQSIFFFLMWDGKPNTPGSPPSANIGIMASDSTSAPQNDWTLSYPYGCLIGSSLYFFDGSLNRLKVVQKEQKNYSWFNLDGPTLASGSTTSAWTNIPIAGTAWPLCNPDLGGAVTLQVRGGGTGTVKIATDVPSESDPQFLYTGTGTGWSFTITLQTTGAAFKYWSSDASALVRILGGVDDT